MCKSKMLIEAAQKMSPFEYFFLRHSAINLEKNKRKIFAISQAKLIS